jgi:4-oxalocrotonate tautomerase
MPFVKIDWGVGRTAEQKRVIAERITSALSEVGAVAAKDVWVVFNDVEPGDWAADGRLTSET